MNWKSEGLALAFGMLIILLVFGDATQISWVGNLDIIFGLTYWRILKAIYPVASIAVFLLYGKSKGTMQFNEEIFCCFKPPHKIISILLDYCQILIFFHGGNFIFCFWSVLQEVKS